VMDGGGRDGVGVPQSGNRAIWDVPAFWKLVRWGLKTNRVS